MHAQRLLANNIQQCIQGENEFAPVLFAMKMAVLEIMSSKSCHIYIILEIM